MTDRRLVPYNPTLLGVDATYRVDEGTASLISGGYLDDVLEAYDDLTFDGWTRVAGHRAMSMSASLLNRPVFAFVWEDSHVSRPCNLHALVTRGVPRARALTVAASVV